MTYPLRPLPLALVLGAFFLVFVPLCLLQAVPNFVEIVPQLALVHAVGLGTTHFFVTLAVYFDRENLAHFARGARNRTVYFAAPLLIFAFFAWLEASDARVRHAGTVAYLLAALRFADFFHVGRQSFGMLQLWKRPAGAELPGWSRTAENVFFVGLAALQWQTFRFGGRFPSGSPYATLPAIALGVLAFAIALSYVRAVELRGAAGRREPLLALSYFAMQACSGAVAVYDTRLYLVGLTLHYVEYHLMMAPRCFAGAEPAWGERGPLAWLRRHPLFFYLGLLSLVIVFELRNQLGGATRSTSTAYFVHLFDGIFFVHYFVEAFLWKLRDPYYKRRLGPLYLEPPSPPGAKAAPPPARASRMPEWLALAAGVALLGLAHAQGLLARAAASVEAKVARPMHIERHLRFGVQLAERGELESAARHAERVLALHPRSVAARQLLSSVRAAQVERRAGEPSP